MRPKRVFEGFPPQTFQFFEELECNNDRTWFAAQRLRVDTCVMRPASAFVGALGERLRRVHPGLVFDARTNGSGSLFRLQRDARFSREGGPYKTNLGFRFWLSEAERAEKRVRLYVHLDTSGVRVYGGEHCQMEPARLALLREAIARDVDGDLVALLAKLSRGGFEIDDQKLSRVPRGYGADHPRADLLRLRSLFVRSPPMSPELAQTPAMVDHCVAHVRALKPLNDWLGAGLPTQ